MTTFVDLNRASYLKLSPDPKRFNYLSAKYKNMRFLVRASQTYLVTSKDMANSFGIAFTIYGDRDYWWIVCTYNGIIDPITGFIPGRILQLPSLSDVNKFLNNQTDGVTPFILI